MRCVPVSRRLVQKSKIVPVFICQEGNEIVNLNLGSVISLQMIINVLGQNGTDKMVWTKWYTDKMVLDKMAWTKWHGHNGTDQILRIKSSFNPALIYNMIVSSIPLPL